MNTSPGQIVKVRRPYYNSATRSTRFKSRPAMIVRVPAANEIDNDYIILPISKISYSEMISQEYDIKIEKQAYPKLNLSEDVSYIRTHKQTVANPSDMLLNEPDVASNLKIEYPDLYYEILEKMASFQENIICNS